MAPTTSRTWPSTIPCWTTARWRGSWTPSARPCRDPSWSRSWRAIWCPQRGGPNWLFFWKIFFHIVKEFEHLFGTFVKHVLNKNGVIWCYLYFRSLNTFRGKRCRLSLFKSHFSGVSWFMTFLGLSRRATSWIKLFDIYSKEQHATRMYKGIQQT